MTEPAPSVGQRVDAPPRARLILCDDHPVVVAGIRSTLEPSYSVVAIVHNGAELLQRVQEVEADCLLLDLMLPDRYGLPLLRAIRPLVPDLKVVILTMLVERAIADACLAAGAEGFVPKVSGPEEIGRAIEAALRGERYVSPRVPKSSHGRGAGRAHPGWERVTDRQEEILVRVGRGERPAEIARALGLQRSTITFHLHNVRRVLGLRSDAELREVAFLTLLDSVATRPPNDSTA